MNKGEPNRQVIGTFITKLCSIERYIETKRQMLCDKSDFEPYAAFQRISRQGSGITARNVGAFLHENLVEVEHELCQSFIDHFDVDNDGMLSYKEFLDVVLPKEHPDLRAFVTQRDCFSIRREEYMDYDTEVALSNLIHLELGLFSKLSAEKAELDQAGFDPDFIIHLIDGTPEGKIDFNNLQHFLHDTGVLPYDSEIIAFLRRVDRDDDGIVHADELHRFLSLFNLRKLVDSHERNTNMSKLMNMSPGRKIAQNKVVMLSPERRKRIVYEEDGGFREEQHLMKKGYILSDAQMNKIGSPLTHKRSKVTKGVLVKSPAKTKVEITEVHGESPVVRQTTTIVEKENTSPPRTYQVAEERTITHSRTFGRRYESPVTHKAATVVERGVTGRSSTEVIVEEKSNFDAFERSKQRTLFSPSRRSYTKISEDIKPQPQAITTRTEIRNSRVARDTEVLEPRGRVMLESKVESIVHEPKPETIRADKIADSRVEKIRETRAEARMAQSHVVPTREQRPSRKEMAASSNIENRRSAGMCSTGVRVFAPLLAGLIVAEKEFEDSKQKLLDNGNFSIRELTLMVAGEGKETFTFEELRGLLSKIGVANCDTRALIDLYSSFDSNVNCMLGANELADILLPNEESTFGDLSESKGSLEKETIEDVKEAFAKLFESRAKLTEARGILRDNNVEFHRMFDVIDLQKRGFVDHTDYQAILQDHEIWDVDIQAVKNFTVINDLDKDGKISFKDFYMYFSA